MMPPSSNAATAQNYSDSCSNSSTGNDGDHENSNPTLRRHSSRSMSSSLSFHGTASPRTAVVQRGRVVAHRSTSPVSPPRTPNTSPHMGRRHRPSSRRAMSAQPRVGHTSLPAPSPAAHTPISACARVQSSTPMCAVRQPRHLPNHGRPACVVSSSSSAESVSATVAVSPGDAPDAVCESVDAHSHRPPTRPPSRGGVGDRHSAQYPLAAHVRIRPCLPGETYADAGWMHGSRDPWHRPHDAYGDGHSDAENGDGMPTGHRVCSRRVVHVWEDDCVTITLPPWGTCTRARPLSAPSPLFGLQPHPQQPWKSTPNESPPTQTPSRKSHVTGHDGQNPKPECGARHPVRPPPSPCARDGTAAAPHANGKSHTSSHHGASHSHPGSDGGADRVVSWTSACGRLGSHSGIPARPHARRSRSVSHSSAVSCRANSTASASCYGSNPSNSSHCSARYPTTDRCEFRFPCVHKESATQAMVFEDSVLPLAEAALRGQNVAVLCYGPTGTGKTYTMMGEMKGHAKRPCSGGPGEGVGGRDDGAAMELPPPPPPHPDDDDNNDDDDESSGDLMEMEVYEKQQQDIRCASTPHEAKRLADDAWPVLTMQPCRVNDGKAAPTAGKLWVRCRARRPYGRPDRHAGGRDAAHGYDGAAACGREGWSRMPPPPGWDDGVWGGGLCATRSTDTAMGILPRLVRLLLSQRGQPISAPASTSTAPSPAGSAQTQTQTLTLVDVTFYAVELYMDELYDLLDRRRRAVTEVDSLSSLCPHLDRVAAAAAHASANGRRAGGGGGARLRTWGDFCRACRRAQGQRATAQHARNDTSSRSHALFILRLDFDLARAHPPTRPPLTRVCASYLTLVDLAGSERVKETGVSGRALREAQYINKSLAALAAVVRARFRRSAHIPYRDARLTRLLRPCLEQGRVLLLVHVAPCDAHDTVQSLRFADQLRHIAGRETDGWELVSRGGVGGGDGGGANSTTGDAAEEGHNDDARGAADAAAWGTDMAGKGDDALAAELRQRDAELRQLASALRLGYLRQHEETLSTPAAPEAHRCSDNHTHTHTHTHPLPHDGTARRSAVPSCGMRRVPYALRGYFAPLWQSRASQSTALQSAHAFYARARDARVGRHARAHARRIDARQTQLRLLDARHDQLTQESAAPVPTDVLMRALLAEKAQALEELRLCEEERAAVSAVVTTARQRRAGQVELWHTLHAESEEDGRGRTDGAAEGRRSPSRHDGHVGYSPHCPPEPPRRVGVGGVRGRQTTGVRQARLARWMMAWRNELLRRALGQRMWEGLWCRAMRGRLHVAACWDAWALRRVWRCGGGAEMAASAVVGTTGAVERATATGCVSRCEKATAAAAAAAYRRPPPPASPAPPVSVPVCPLEPPHTAQWRSPLDGCYASRDTLQSAALAILRQRGVWCWVTEIAHDEVAMRARHRIAATTRSRHAETKSSSNNNNSHNNNNNNNRSNNSSNLQGASRRSAHGMATGSSACESRWGRWCLVRATASTPPARRGARDDRTRAPSSHGSDAAGHTVCRDREGNTEGASGVENEDAWMLQFLCRDGAEESSAATPWLRFSAAAPLQVCLERAAEDEGVAEVVLSSRVTTTTTTTAHSSRAHSWRLHWTDESAMSMSGRVDAVEVLVSGLAALTQKGLMHVRLRCHRLVRPVPVRQAATHDDANAPGHGSGNDEQAAQKKLSVMLTRVAALVRDGLRMPIPPAFPGLSRPRCRVVASHASNDGTATTAAASVLSSPPQWSMRSRCGQEGGEWDWGGRIASDEDDESDEEEEEEEEACGDGTPSRHRYNRMPPSPPCRAMPPEMSIVWAMHAGLVQRESVRRAVRREVKQLIYDAVDITEASPATSHASHAIRDVVQEARVVTGLWGGAGGRGLLRRAAHTCHGAPESGVNRPERNDDEKDNGRRGMSGKVGHDSCVWSTTLTVCQAREWWGYVVPWTIWQWAAYWPQLQQQCSLYDTEEVGESGGGGNGVRGRMTCVRLAPLPDYLAQLWEPLEGDAGGSGETCYRLL